VVAVGEGVWDDSAAGRELVTDCDLRRFTEPSATLHPPALS
jgi:hypothetical protein